MIPVGRTEQECELGLHINQVGGCWTRRSHGLSRSNTALSRRCWFDLLNRGDTARGRSGKMLWKSASRCSPASEATIQSGLGSQEGNSFDCGGGSGGAADLWCLHVMNCAMHLAVLGGCEHLLGAAATICNRLVQSLLQCCDPTSA